MREELRQRLAKEYRYSATKMKDSPQAIMKLYYFSVLFGEAQRVLNWEWDRDLALIYTVAYHVHAQINTLAQAQTAGQVLPTDWATAYDKLTEATSNLAAYFEKSDDNTEELNQILGRFAEISYIVSGNGSYLYEKGHIKFESST